METVAVGLASLNGDLNAILLTSSEALAVFIWRRVFLAGQSLAGLVFVRELLATLINARIKDKLSCPVVSNKKFRRIMIAG